MTKFSLFLPRALGFLLSLASPLVLTGCGSDVDNEASFRVIHVASDSPPVNILVDGVALRSFLDYRNSTGFVFVTPRNYAIGVQAILPGGNVLIVDKPVVPFIAGKEYSVLAIGLGADSTLDALIIENPFASIPENTARLQFVHAAPATPPVDIYLTPLDGDLAAATPLAQVTYGQAPPARQLVNSGTYRLRLTPAGAIGPVLFDSGQVTLLSRDDFLLVVAPSLAPGPAPVSLLVNSRLGSAEILDKNTPSDLRVIHVSPNTPALDVLGDPATVSSPEVLFARDLPYLGFTQYVPAVPDTFLVRGVLSTDPLATPPLFSFARSLFLGQRTTLLATNLLENISSLVLQDEIRPIFAEAKLRFVDGSPAGGVVDVYLVSPGTDLATVNPTLQNLVLGSATGHLPFVIGDYTAIFTTAGTKTVLASTPVAATGGIVLTLVLVDEARDTPTSDGLPLSVLVVPDLLT